MRAALLAAGFTALPLDGTADGAASGAASELLERPAPDEL